MDLYTIIPYKETWPDEFKEIAVQLRGALGDLALRIDHIGSTSVPGLAAKDVIDLQITVAVLDQQIIAAMEELGYSYAGPDMQDHHPPGFTGLASEWEKMYFRPPSNQRRTHTHVRVAGRANQRYALLFRDYLRAHPASAEAYARLKHHLAANLADKTTYPDVKDPAVDLIYFAAEAWRERVMWNPGNSDA